MNLSLLSLFSVAAAIASTSAFAPPGASTRVSLHFQHAMASSLAATQINDEADSKVAPIDHEFELAVNRIRGLVFRWMSIFDENRGDAAPLLDLMSPEGFVMHLTSQEEPVTTIKDLQKWFGDLETQVKAVNHRVQTIDVTKLDDGAFAVNIFLNCPGMSTSNVPFNLSSVHNWEVVDYGGQYPKIRVFATKVVNPDGSPLSFDQAKP